jgi:hypothetical protein
MYMSSEKVTTFVTRLFAPPINRLFLITVSIVLLESCSEAPLEPCLSSWFKVTDLPRGAEDLYARDRNFVWIVGSDNNEAVIWRWDGVSLVEEFNYGIENSSLRCIDYFEGTAWAAGDIIKDDFNEALLLKYEDGRWNAVAGPAGTRFGFSKVAGSGKDECWLKGYREIFNYKNGVWERYGNFLGVSGITAYGPARVFAWSDLGPYVSVFDGSDWVIENIDLPGSFSSSIIIDGCATPSALFLTCSIFTDTDQGYFDYGAILRREYAPAGQGKYDLVFFSPPGPYFSSISSLAFVDDKNGIGAGYFTSIVCDDGVFTKEIVDPEFGTPINVSALGSGDYWLLSELEGGRKMLYRRFE